MQDEGKGPMGGFLTSDNSYLSRPNPGLVPGSAGDCTDLPAAVAGFVRASLADNSRRAYLSDLRHFEHWGAAFQLQPKLLRVIWPHMSTRFALQPWSGGSRRYRRHTRREGCPIQPAQSWSARR
jgi:hypothetical protein